MKRKSAARVAFERHCSRAGITSEQHRQDVWPFFEKGWKAAKRDSNRPGSGLLATGEGPCPRTGERHHRWADGFCHKCGAKRP